MSRLSNIASKKLPFANHDTPETDKVRAWLRANKKHKKDVKIEMDRQTFLAIALENKEPLGCEGFELDGHAFIYPKPLDG